MSPHRHKHVAGIVAGQIANGVLPPGAPAPSGAALSRMTGYSVHTCRQGGAHPSPRQRPGPWYQLRRTPARPDPSDQTLADAKYALSAALAEHRRGAGLTRQVYRVSDLLGTRRQFSKLLVLLRLLVI
jgi:hypothetical protein